MINRDKAVVVWNKVDNRPATVAELIELDNNDKLIINFVLNISQEDAGLVWIDLDDATEEEFEIRRERQLESVGVV